MNHIRFANQASLAHQVLMAAGFPLYTLPAI